MEGMPSILPVATLVTSSICLRRPSGKTYDRTCIQSLPYYTVMVVETSDVTTNCQLIMYVRYLKDRKNRTSFGGTVTIANGRADTIKDSILQFLAVYQLPLQKMYAFGSDGAAVMVGRKNGVEGGKSCKTWFHISCLSTVLLQIGTSHLVSNIVLYDPYQDCPNHVPLVKIGQAPVVCCFT